MSGIFGATPPAAQPVPTQAYPAVQEAEAAQEMAGENARGQAATFLQQQGSMSASTAKKTLLGGG